MKLLKALYWYYFKYRPEPADRYLKLQVEKMGGLIIAALIGLVYFFVNGLIANEVKQIWGCGIGLLLMLLPALILSMILLAKYDEHTNTKDN
jgi:hypothetical protein